MSKLAKVTIERVSKLRSNVEIIVDGQITYSCCQSPLQIDDTLRSLRETYEVEVTRVSLLRLSAHRSQRSVI